MSLDIINLYAKENTKNTKKIEFAFAQAEKIIEASIADLEAIESKANQLGAFLFAVATLSAGTFLTATFDSCSSLHRTSIIISAFIFTSLILLSIKNLINILGIMEYHSIGNDPQNLLKVKRESLYQLKVESVTDYQKYIKHNEENNNTKANKLKEVYAQLKIILFYPFVVLLCFELLPSIILGLGFFD